MGSSTSVFDSVENSNTPNVAQTEGVVILNIENAIELLTANYCRHECSTHLPNGISLVISKYCTLFFEPIFNLSTIDPSLDLFKFSDDKKCVTFNKFGPYGGHVMFGGFIDDPHLKVTVHLKTHGCHEMRSGIGFISDQFTDFNQQNFGSEYCCILDGNGFVCISSQFRNLNDLQYKHGQIYEHLNDFFVQAEDETLVICCDSFTGIGTIYNKKYENESEKHFKIGLPANASKIAIIVFMDQNYGQTMKIVHHKIEYCFIQRK